MTAMSATTLARSLSRVLDRLEHGGQEIVITRNDHAIARLVPGTNHMTALEACADLYGVLSEEEGAAWLKDVRSADRKLASELEDPWES